MNTENHMHCVYIFNEHLREPRYKHEFIDRVQFEWWSLDPGGGGNSDVSNFSKLISLTNNVPIFLSNFFPTQHQDKVDGNEAEIIINNSWENW